MLKKWLFMTLFIPLLGFSQTESNIGPYVSGVFPLDQMASTHGFGFEAGAIWNYHLTNGIFLSVGGSYNFLPGETAHLDSVDQEGNYYQYDLKIPDYDFYKIIVGPKFVNQHRYFIFPALIGVLDTDDYRRLGFEISIGHNFELTKKIGLEAGAKIAWLNLFLKKDDAEKTIKTFQVGVALLF